LNAHEIDEGSLWNILLVEALNASSSKMGAEIYLSWGLTSLTAQAVGLCS
jgi:hypothetical protein